MIQEIKPQSAPNTVTKWRQQLEAIGGYENELVPVPAGAVRQIIDDLEATKKQLAAAQKQHVRDVATLEAWNNSITDLQQQLIDASTAVVHEADCAEAYKAQAAAKDATLRQVKEKLIEMRCPDFALGIADSHIVMFDDHIKATIKLINEATK